MYGLVRSFFEMTANS